MYNVLVSDEYEIIRTGVTYLVNEQDQFKVVTQTSSWADTIRQVEQNEVNIVITGLDMPGENGVLKIKRLHEAFPNISIFILSKHEERDLINDCVKNGADSYILKSSPNCELINALNVVAKGKKYIDHNILLSERDIERINSHGLTTIKLGYNILSKREKEVFPLITLGYGNKEIAKKLCISIKTVEAHKAKIMHKLSLKGQVDLIHYAVKHHLVKF
ncbi:MAG: response regulator transcription factor [Lentilactobacillus diolivorans]|jgi:two-component system response regulator NreC|uniref:Response regulator n=2 Tax=Lentilactobacillus diolivorans TaxID=179838 RepID=A0A0R1SQT5_9LACO|nr:response regulator transcription factor [Lentilactobacillus diolivorans]RRG04421.1 MAG: DNA-binding response regulator [Lactobacillus sp.]KRL69066.1 response regulator [Lentilactobacillus diolivorans DSM 14421]MCH4164226.1 response regulator transcription factor [Lentilactobacillus diolivorans]MDH5104624.1 response regulator transcription factor [Lentilactobacillus diolivorans]GEP22488.1 DNA-binding response regulator [Lentilactobacillus diolivorans]